MKNILMLLVITFFVSGCASVVSDTGAVASDTGAVMSDGVVGDITMAEYAPLAEEKGGYVEKYIVVDVYYGTDRKNTGDKMPAKRYGIERGEFEYGVAKVSIPNNHKAGELESPVWWKFEFSENPENHIVLLDVSLLDANLFHDRIKADMNERNNDDIFVFVHGFNVTFEDSMRRTAQLVYDLGYPGIPVAYSWPSQGTPSPLSYTTDHNYSEWSFPHLKKFLIDIKRKTHAKKIHVLAHSMGNQVLTRAIKSIDSRELKLNQVILAAPDIDSQIFKENIAPYLLGKADRFSMYVSSKDAALILSNRIQKGHRVGQAGDEIVVVDGIDTIDASLIDTSVLGHSYYGDERELIMDLYHLIKNGIPPKSRNLKPHNNNGMLYWELKK